MRNLFVTNIVKQNVQWRGKDENRKANVRTRDGFRNQSISFTNHFHNPPSANEGKIDSKGRPPFISRSIIYLPSNHTNSGQGKEFPTFQALKALNIQNSYTSPTLIF